jgi:hypothetical protein
MLATNGKHVLKGSSLLTPAFADEGASELREPGAWNQTGSMRPASSGVAPALATLRRSRSGSIDTEPR